MWKYARLCAELKPQQLVIVSVYQAYKVMHVDSAGAQMNEERFICQLIYYNTDVGAASIARMTFSKVLLDVLSL